MATNNVDTSIRALIMRAKFLDKDQIKYELRIRNEFDNQDNQQRRLRRLGEFLAAEQSGSRQLVTGDENIDQSMNATETQAAYQRLLQIIGNGLSAANIQEVETHTEHLLPNQIRLQYFVEVQKDLDALAQRIIDFYDQLESRNQSNVHVPPTENLHQNGLPNAHSTPPPSGAHFTNNMNRSRAPNGHSQNSNAQFQHNAHPPHFDPNVPNPHGHGTNNTSQNPPPIDMNLLGDIINRTVNEAMDRRFNEHTSSQNRHQNNINNTQNNRQHHHGEINDREFDAFNNFNGNRSFRRPNHSPPHRINRNYIEPISRVNVLDWRFHFSGLTALEEPRTLDVETFIRKLKDHMRSESVHENDILSKVQQLLRGPASDWYSHAGRRIQTWAESEQKLRDRFSATNNFDVLRQLIYSKTQQSGEFTLRYIDQCVNLIDRLPEAVSEQQRVFYILGGIRPEIGRMARTANVQSVDNLINYIIMNYGQNDKFELSPRPPPTFPVRVHSRKQIEEINVEADSGDDEYNEYERYEMQAITAPRVKLNKPKKSNAGELKSDSETMQNTPSPLSNPIPNWCCAKLINSQLCHAKNHCYAHSCSSAVHTDKLTFKSNCPFCNGEHFYEDCPLPSDEKPRHCFLCKSEQHIAPKCPTNANKNVAKSDSLIDKKPGFENRSNIISQQQPSELNSNSLKNLLETQRGEEPAYAYCESLIHFPRYDMRPHISATVGNTTLTGLLDTGSHVTVIGQNLYESIDWNVDLRPMNTIVITADGTRHAILGMLMLTYAVEGKSRIVPTLVMPVVMKKPLFGIDFQRIFGITMSFSEISVLDSETPKEPITFNAHVLSPPTAISSRPRSKNLTYSLRRGDSQQNGQNNSHH